MIEDVVKHHGAPFDPDKPDELTDWVRAYYPARKVKSETVRRTACKMREEQRSLWTGDNQARTLEKQPDKPKTGDL